MPSNFERTIETADNEPGAENQAPDLGIKKKSSIQVNFDDDD